jgi:hypothetical protein
MAERNTQGASRPRRTLAGATVHMVARGGGFAVRASLVVAGWLLAIAAIVVFLWVTIGVEEGMPLVGLAFIYVLRTVLGSLLLALVVVPVTYVLPKAWRAKARTLKNRHVALAIALGIVLVAIFVALQASQAFGR